MDTQKITDKIATLQRAIKSSPTKVLTEKLKSKVAELKQNLKDSNITTFALAKNLLGSQNKIAGYSKEDFNNALKRLSARDEYSFLKGMSKGKVKDDIKRFAKPVGWRFKGRNNIKTPTAKELAIGKKNGSVYFEDRINRSDVVRPAKLKQGGVVWEKTKDGIFVLERLDKKGKPYSDYWVTIGEHTNKLEQNYGLWEVKRGGWDADKSYRRTYSIKRFEKQSEAEKFMNDWMDSIKSKFKNGGAVGSYMGEKGDKVVIETTGKDEYTLYHITNSKTFDKVDMFFDSEEEVKKYADKRGLVIVKEFENNYKTGGTTTQHKYKLGDKYRSDFDYDGMIEMGQKASISWGVAKLTKLHDSFEDVNYHTESPPLWKAIQYLKDGRNSLAKLQLDEFHKLIEAEITGENEGEKNAGEDFDVTSLIGSHVAFYYVGVPEPEYAQITGITTTPAHYQHRDVTFQTGQSETKFPLSSLQDFLNGKEITIKGGKEPYVVVLEGKFKHGGNTKRDGVIPKAQCERMYSEIESHKMEDGGGVDAVINKQMYVSTICKNHNCTEEQYHKAVKHYGLGGIVVGAIAGALGTLALTSNKKQPKTKEYKLMVFKGGKLHDTLIVSDSRVQQSEADYKKLGYTTRTFPIMKTGGSISEIKEGDIVDVPPPHYDKNLKRRGKVNYIEETEGKFGRTNVFYHIIGLNKEGFIGAYTREELVEGFKTGGNIFIDKEDGTINSVEKNEKGVWTIFSENKGKWAKRDEFENGFASEEDAILVAKEMAGITKQRFKNGGGVSEQRNIARQTEISRLMGLSLDDLLKEAGMSKDDFKSYGLTKGELIKDMAEPSYKTGGGVRLSRGRKMQKIKLFLDKFPDNATTWIDATDEPASLNNDLADYISGYKGNVFVSNGGELPDNTRSTPATRN